MLEFSLYIVLGAACYVLGRIHGYRRAVHRAAVIVGQFADTLKRN